MAASVTIFAHVDAGKTTLSEQILYKSGTIRSAGRVDRKNTLLDFNDVERERGITVFSAQSSFSWRDREFYLIDTPGHADFSGEMERSMLASDCAVLVVSAVEGVQSHTVTVFRLLEKQKIPAVFFINKIDRQGADVKKVCEQLNKLTSDRCIDFTDGFCNGVFSDSLAENVVSFDEELMEKYLNGECDDKLLREYVSKAVVKRELFPVCCGSALNAVGIESLLDLLFYFAPETACCEDDSPSAVVYQVRHDKNGQRIAYLKVKSGVIHPKDELKVKKDKDTGEDIYEKIGELRRYSGSKFVPLTEAKAGTICAVTGISSMPGQIIGESFDNSVSFSLTPLLSAELIFDEKKHHPHTVLGIMKTIEDEEPLLGVEWNEYSGKIQVRIMGEIQLEILTKMLLERYGLEVSFGECDILYRETIAAPVNGCGHFEPLRHYAEVHLRLEPSENEGITFKSECHTDYLAQNWQNLIRTHVLEKEHRGVLTGAPLTNVNVVLTAGRAHLKHTEGGDFREAVYRAIRQGLMNAENVLLEPWYEFEAEAATELSGRIISDIQRMNGECDVPYTVGENTVIKGRAPVFEMRNYAKELTAFSKGKGRLSLSFYGYRPCKNSEEIIAKKGYEPERDLENTPDSVFCSHGAGFTVKWYDVPEYMHIKS